MSTSVEGLTSHKVKRYGWTPDLPDHRDHLYSAPRLPTSLPPKVDLRPSMPPVYDQGQLGSCTGNAIAGAIHYGRRKQGLRPDFPPSRLFIYYNERFMENSVNEDAGAMIRDGIKSVATVGVPPEVPDWPYDIAKFAKKPPATAYKNALPHKSLAYQRLVNSLQQMKGCLATGYPFVFGFSVYEGFESDAVYKTGQLNMPASSEVLLGGHAVLAVGYDDSVQRFTVRNSYGPRWGVKGYFTIPYAYLMDSNLADDFWTIRVVAG